MEKDSINNVFKCNVSINNIVSLYYDKKLYNQSLDCITCLYNGLISLASATQSTKLICNLAGEELIHDLIEKTMKKNNNDIIVTRPYNYPSRFLFHIVAPTFVPKYAYASYTRLHYLYWRVMSLAVEMRIESIGIACLHRPDEGFVGSEGVRIALRTVRRFLENIEDLTLNLKRIILFVPRKSEQLFYRDLMPLYFPCNDAEERLSSQMSKCEIGGVNGEPVSLEERNIRIQPLTNAFSSLQNINDDDTKHQVDKSFLRMDMNFDEQRIRSLRRKTAVKQTTRRPIAFAQLSASKIDGFANPRLLYRGGRDLHGRHVVVFVASHFPSKSSHSFPAWFTQRLADVAAEKYSMVYLHTHALWTPNAACLKNFWSLVDRRFADNLSQVYVLHADNGDRLKCWLSLDTTIYKKLKFVRGVEDLYAYIPCHQITLPCHVLDHDLAINGVRYYTGPVAELPDQ